jgi:hypothetical protein
VGALVILLYFSAAKKSLLSFLLSSHFLLPLYCLFIMVNFTGSNLTSNLFLLVTSALAFVSTLLLVMHST